MLKVFNSFQIVTLFAAFPHIISWLSTAQFAGATVALYSSYGVYFASFIAAIAFVVSHLDD